MSVSYERGNPVGVRTVGVADDAGAFEEVVDKDNWVGLRSVRKEAVSSSCSLTSNLSKSDQQLTTHRSPLTDNQEAVWLHATIDWDPNRSVFERSFYYSAVLKVFLILIPNRWE